MKLKKLMKNIMLPISLITGATIPPLVLNTSCNTNSSDVNHTIILYNNNPTNSVCKATCSWTDKNNDGNFTIGNSYTFTFEGMNGATDQDIHIGYETSTDVYTLSVLIEADYSDVDTNHDNYFTIVVNETNTLTINCIKSTQGNVSMQWAGMTSDMIEQSYYGPKQNAACFTWSDFLFQID